jgi:integrase
VHRYVKESPKTEAGNRDVIIPDNWSWILKRLRMNNPFGEWVFMHNGKRYTADAFRKRIRTVCKKLSIDPKSPHKIRKTYGSILYDSGVPKSLMCSQMGHTDVSCLEKHYYYNRNTDDEKEKYINGIVGL